MYIYIYVYIYICIYICVCVAGFLEVPHFQTYEESQKADPEFEKKDWYEEDTVAQQSDFKGS